MRLTSARQIPRRVRRYAQVAQLGEPRILYEPPDTARLHFILGPIALWIGAVIIGSYYFFYTEVFSWWPAEQALLVLLVGAAWLLIAVWIIVPPLCVPHVHVYLCRQGLIYRRRGLDVIRWDQIDRLAKELNIDKQQSTFAYHITRKDGRRFILKSDLPHLDRLGGFLEREVTRHLLPRSIAAYDSQVPLEFADLRLTGDGICLKSQQKLLPWQELASMLIDDSSISIKRKGDAWDWATLSVSGIPNLGVLQAVVAHVLQASSLSPQMEAYAAGCSFFFGALSVSNAGIMIDISEEEFIPWNAVGSLGVGESEIIIRKKGQISEWRTIPITKVVEVSALEELLAAIFTFGQD